MLKLRCALGLAIFAGILTLMIGVMNDTRSMTLLHRTLISLVIFGICGYIYGTLADVYLPVVLQAIKGSAADVIPGVAKETAISNAAEAIIPDETAGSESNFSFTPLTPERLESVPRSQE